MTDKAGKEYKKRSSVISKNKGITERKAKRKANKEENWIRLMKIGEKTGCHQRADRSFFFRGMQFPVCARCTGVFIAYIGSLLYYIYCFLWQRKRVANGKDKGKIPAIIGCALMFLDWLIQALHIKESTNVRRLITGFVGGLGIMHFYRVVLRFLYRKGKELF